MTDTAYDQEHAHAAPPLLKAIFHVHTHWSSDGSLSPKELIERAIDHGVDALAVTDHNEIQGAVEVARQAPFQVIVGEEIRTTEGGEIIGLFLTELIPKLTPAKEVIDRIHTQGGLVYLPHPFDTVRKKRFTQGLLDELAEGVDIVETFNARNLQEGANTRARAYAERYGKVPCAGADVHIPPELGRTFVELPPFTSPAELLDALRRARHTEVPNALWMSIASQWYQLTKHPRQV